MTTAALIVAAGRGSRVGDAAGPKQYRDLNGVPMLAIALRPFLEHPHISRVVAVIHPDDMQSYQCAVARLPTDKLGHPLPGGASRQASVRAGLEGLTTSNPKTVLIHDAARPFVSREIIDRVLGVLEGGQQAALAALPLADTLKRATPNQVVSETIERSGLWRAQTPQGFNYRTILDAHRRAASEAQRDFTDDAAIAEWAGISVAVVAGDEANFKITTQRDIELAERFMKQQTGTMETRTGNGFDVHRFCPGDHVWLCGIKIPHTHGLEGHSDADVALHALTDALLGALGDGDIGQHFPPSDPKWKGAPSHLFLSDAASRVAARGGRVINTDITILCESPRIGPHRSMMQAQVAQILAIEPARVGIKATTTEGLGFTGRREGIAAMANASILLPA